MNDSKTVQKGSWITMLVLGVFIALSTIALMIFGFVGMVQGVIFVAVGTITAVLAATQFRRGQRWAWLVLWVFPLLMVYTTIDMVITGQMEPAPLYGVLSVISIVVMLLPARRMMAQTS